MKQWNDKPLIIASLISLQVYAEHLATTDLEMNREKIGQIHFLSKVMASYHCVEGYEADADGNIRNKYLMPLEELLAGKQVPMPDFNEAHMKAIINGLNYYREEVKLDYDPVYEQDIRLCTELSEEMNQKLVQNGGLEWGHNMQL